LTKLHAKDSFTEILIKDLGSGSVVAKTMVNTIVNLLDASVNERLGLVIEGWCRDVFQLAGHESDVLDSLGEAYSLPGYPASRLLFCIHTYGAIILKLLAAELTSTLAGPGMGTSFLSILLKHHRAMDIKAFTRDLIDLESGALFKQWLGVGNFPGKSPFSWYLDALDEKLARAIVQVVEKLSCIELPLSHNGHDRTRDVFKALYHDLIPGSIRHGLGEYYTPDWLARFLLDKVHFTVSSFETLALAKNDVLAPFELTLLDPSCGSGTFLIEAIERLRRYATKHDCLDALASRLVTSVAGFDLNPLAVLAAKVNYLLAAGDLLARAGGADVPVHEIDPILTGNDGDPASFPPGVARGIDFVIGNPPWILWDNLPPSYLEATRPAWTRYGLDKYASSITRQLAVKRDISILFTYACVDKLARQGGRIGFLITQSVFKSKGAGETFRHFRYDEPASEGEGRARVSMTVPLRIDVVHDFTPVQPFTGASTKTTAFIATKGAETVYPVKYYEWERTAGASIDPDDVHAMDLLHYRLKRAIPADDQNPCSPWITVPRDALPVLQTVRGPCHYDAFEGINTGGANGIFYLDIAGTREVEDAAGMTVKVLDVVNHGQNKGRVPRREAIIEDFFVYPLIKSRNVKRWGIEGHGYILQMQDPATRIGHDEATVRSRFPLTYRYLDSFRDALLARKSKYIRGMTRKGAFYSMINVSPAIYAPYKVIWNRMGSRINACVASTVDDEWLGTKTVIPDDVLAYIPVNDVNEAHYICAVMNSSITRFLLEAIAGGSKSFGTPTIVKDTIRIGKYSQDNPLHVQLARKSREAHDLVKDGKSDGMVDQEIDTLVAMMHGLSEAEFKFIGIRNFDIKNPRSSR